MPRGRTANPACIWLLACAVAALCVLAFAQEGAAPIRVDVRLVHILATVKDQNGSPVGGLEKTNFELRDNGALQQIAVFERQTEQPLSIAILIDHSGSTASDLRYEIDSVTRFVRAVTRSGNEHDAVALYSFNWEVVKETVFTRDAAIIDRRLHELRGLTGTAMYDAILLASRDVQDRQGRKVLVVVTDGGDTVSRISFARAAEAAQLADAVIYPVLVISPVTRPTPVAISAARMPWLRWRRAPADRCFNPRWALRWIRPLTVFCATCARNTPWRFYPRNVPLTTDRFHTLSVTAV